MSSPSWLLETRPSAPGGWGPKGPALWPHWAEGSCVLVPGVGFLVCCSVFLHLGELPAYRLALGLQEPGVIAEWPVSMRSPDL